MIICRMLRRSLFLVAVVAVLAPASALGEGPAGGEPPWVISGDTGIHPSEAGYAQMPSRLPAPG